jgi:hypothetical protein
MKYQLVLQWPSSSSTSEYAHLIALEEAIRNGLSERDVVDGHDIGTGAMNIFIHTDNPESAFEKAKLLLSSPDDLSRLRAGYRDFDEGEYIPISPKRLRRFSVI